MDISEKCELLKETCMVLLEEVKEKHIENQKEYEALCIQRKKNKSEEIEKAVDENIAISAALFNKKFDFQDMIELITFLQNADRYLFKYGIDLMKPLKLPELTCECCGCTHDYNDKNEVSYYSNTGVLYTMYSLRNVEEKYNPQAHTLCNECAEGFQFEEVENGEDGE